jgi:hypothetical protein
MRRSRFNGFVVFLAAAAGLGFLVYQTMRPAQSSMMRGPKSAELLQKLNAPTSFSVSNASEWPNIALLAYPKNSSQGEARPEWIADGGTPLSDGFKAYEFWAIKRDSLKDNETFGSIPPDDSRLMNVAISPPEAREMDFRGTASVALTIDRVAPKAPESSEVVFLSLPEKLGKQAQEAQKRRSELMRHE